MRKHTIVPLEKNSTTEYPEFAERLNYAMRIRDCTNLTLSKHIFVSPPAISSYRSGTRQPNFEVLRSIALALGVSTDFLLGLSDYIDVSKTHLYRKTKEEENYPE